MRAIDLNCDLGEGAGHDEELMPLISSANIACGGHAGDEATMRATVALAEKHGVMIGAHPVLVDREHFGRRELPVTPQEVYELVLAQTRRLQAMARVRHVKPHGALYNMAARDVTLARAVAEAVKAADPALILVGLAGSRLLEAGKEVGLRVLREGFVDRTYRADGSLTPRSAPRSLLTEPLQAIGQGLVLAKRGVVVAVDGTTILMPVDTICIHGDGERAVEFARHFRRACAEAGVVVTAP